MMSRFPKPLDACKKAFAAMDQDQLKEENLTALMAQLPTTEDIDNIKALAEIDGVDKLDVPEQYVLSSPVLSFFDSVLSLSSLLLSSLPAYLFLWCRFYLMLSTIPKLQLRLTCWIYVQKFPEQFTELDNLLQHNLEASKVLLSLILFCSFSAVFVLLCRLFG
jgi:hypothetical protein